MPPKSKKCSVCGNLKPLSDFSKNAAKKDGLQTTCRACKKTYNAGYYELTKHVHNPNRARTRELARERNLAWAVDYLNNHPCVDCGEEDIVVLQFDHQRDKLSDVSKLIYSAASLARLITEVAKCEVVCANCHQRRTATTNGWLKLGFT